MNILIFLALIFATVVLSILINRLVRCPLLVGLVFFSVTLLVAAILENTTLVIVAVILGIIGFLSAFLDCIFKRCDFVRDNCCLNCYNPYNTSNNDNGNNSNSNNSNDEALSIVNSDGEIVARINGNIVNCNNVCSCNRNYRRR